MKAISLRRRCAIALVSLGLAACFFRGQLATALVTRGDDAMRNGDGRAAIRYYSRALSLDARAGRAADRLAFSLATQRQPSDARAAIAIATTALVNLPDDPDLLVDRGLAEQHLGRWLAAENDFARAGSLGRDPRYDHLAGRIALRLGDNARARALFASALARDPAFMPARVALAHVR